MAQTTTSDVIAFILSDRCYPGDRSRIIEALNRSRAVASAKAAGVFHTGQKVRFLNTNTGIVTEGRVTKVNRMTVKLRTDNGMNWRVSPTLLEACPPSHPLDDKGMPKAKDAKKTEEFVDLAAFDPSKF